MKSIILEYKFVYISITEAEYIVFSVRFSDLSTDNMTWK